jgi:hypothetical protein
MSALTWQPPVLTFRNLVRSSLKMNGIVSHKPKIGLHLTVLLSIYQRILWFPSTVFGIVVASSARSTTFASICVLFSLFSVERFFLSG